ncbi:MAG: transposase [Gammaproteobacteria bacterium]|nr:MAG: transposase [Gammaproteobacteria bacterium]
MHRSHLLRVGRISLPGHLYHVTFVTRDRVPLLESFDSAREVVRTLMGLDRRSHCLTWTYVVMPDHVHWLFQLGGSLSLSGLVALAKSRSSHYLRRHGLKGPVWQRGFMDRLIRARENPVAVARYIVLNPLRAGLVARLGDYPHWDARWL